MPQKIAIISKDDDLQQLLLQHSDQLFDNILIEHYYAVEDVDINNFSVVISTEKLLSGKNVIYISSELPEKADNIICLNKPLRLSSLISNIEKLLVASNDDVQIGEISFSYKRRYIKNKRISVSLTEKEAEIILYLYQRFPEVSDKQELLRNIWQYGENIDTHTLESHIYRLRQKLNKIGNIIVTSGNGYLLQEN